jgi:hypothetical protein
MQTALHFNGIYGKWCGRNGLSLTVSKCNVMTFSLKHANRYYEYKLGDSLLRRLSVAKDDTFDQKSAITDHYDSIIQNYKHW